MMSSPSMHAARARSRHRGPGEAALVLGALVALLGWSPCAGVAAQESGPRYQLRAHVSQSYTSNLFHEQSRRLPLFDPHVEQEPGYPETDRYHGMDGPSDFVTEPGLAAGVAWKLGKRRSLSLELGAQYAIHARNPIADHLSLAAEVRYKLGKRDSLSLEAGFVPKRFVKNYPYNRYETLNYSLFHRADRQELDSQLSYRHAWTKRVRSELGLALNVNRYDMPFDRKSRPLLATETLDRWNAPFGNRNSNEYAATLASSYAPLAALEVELGVGFGITLTPHELEYNDYPVDRSHHDVEPHVQVALDLPASFAAALGFGARVRQFETHEPRDDTYYDRHDVRLELDAELSKGFGRRFEVSLQAGYQDNNPYRAKPSADADDYGFEELTLGLALTFRLD